MSNSRGSLHLLDDKDPVSHLTYAVFLDEIGDKELTEKHFKAAIELDPNYLNANQAYAVFLGKCRKRNADAINQFEKTLNLDPDNVPAINAYARFLCDKKLSRKQAKRAEELFLKALSIDPGHIQSRLSYALLLKRQKRFKEAEVQFRAAIESEEDTYAARQAYAVFLKEQEEYSRAQEQFLKAFDPRLKRYKSRLHNAMIHNAYADLLDKMGAIEKEITSHFEQALDVDPDDSKARFHLLLTHKAFGEFLCRKKKLEDAMK